jgi:hypothetical protein
MAKFGAATVFLWLVSVSEVLAGGSPGGGGTGLDGGPSSAPEIDGPAGIAAIALLASAGIIAYNRYKRK